MKKTLNAGIVGTGFGSYVLLEALNQINFVKDIAIGHSTSFSSERSLDCLGISRKFILFNLF